MAKTIQKLRKRCVCCGKRITITKYEDGRYRGGEYFGVHEFPVGKGEHKKVGTFKFGDLKGDVTEWTGKKKKFEHWECKDCYMEGMHESWLDEMIEKVYGNRCKDYDKDCPCCRAWDVYDGILKELRKNDPQVKMSKTKRKNKKKTAISMDLGVAKTLGLKIKKP